MCNRHRKQKYTIRNQLTSEFKQLARAIDAYFIKMPEEVNNTAYVFQFVVGFVILICCFMFAN